MAARKRKPKVGSAQARWAAKMHKRGRCRVCGNKLGTHKWLCNEHQEKFNTYMKEWRAKRKAAKQSLLAQSTITSPNTISPNLGRENNSNE